LAKDDLAVHRDDREDQRKTLAVAVRPCGSDFGPEAFVTFVGDMPCLEGRRFGSGGCGAGCACHDEFLSFRFGSLPPSDRLHGKGRASCPTRVNAENRRGPDIDARPRAVRKG
jgi:hypothetical protein